jgi:hypothetical protein
MVTLALYMVWYIFMSARGIQNAKVQRMHVETVFQNRLHLFSVIS